MEACYSIIQQDNEYRILLTPVNTGGLPVNIQQVLSARKIEISELIIERISGDSTTGQEVLHDITGWIAEMFASNPNMIIYYSCDDMTPIPSRNKNSDNRDMPVNEYRSRLFSHIFDTYMTTHRCACRGCPGFWKTYHMWRKLDLVLHQVNFLALNALSITRI